MADRWQKNERYLLMIQYQILFLNIHPNFVVIRLNIFSTFWYQMTHCVLLLHTVSKKKSWSYSVGLQEGGEAEPSIFSWLKGTFQFDWKIFLYFGWGKYDAFGKSWNLNLMIFKTKKNSLKISTLQWCFPNTTSYT